MGLGRGRRILREHSGDENRESRGNRETPNSSGTFHCRALLHRPREAPPDSNNSFSYRLTSFVFTIDHAEIYLIRFPTEGTRRDATTATDQAPRWVGEQLDLGPERGLAILEDSHANLVAAHRNTRQQRNRHNAVHQVTRSLGGHKSP